MIVIGVTGGMASGKSTVARMISGRAILHIDADKIVHQLMREDRQTISSIAAAFPSAVAKGAIVRAELAKAVGENPKALQKLEHILHPRVRQKELEAINFAHRNGLRAVVLDIPLLFETDAHEICDIVIVAHAPLAIRRRRAFARPGMSDVKWEKLLSRQLQDHHRHPAADYIVPTNLGKAVTRRTIHRIKRQLKLGH